MSQNISEIINNISDDNEHAFAIARDVYTKNQLDSKYLKNEKPGLNFKNKIN